MISAAVLTGALLIGDSVDHTLKSMAFQRLADTELAMISGENFYTQNLAKKMQKDLEVNISALLTVPGFVSNDNAAESASVNVIGVDENFFKLADAKNPFKAPENQNTFTQLLINTPLAEKLNVKENDEIVMRFAKASRLSKEMPLSSSQNNLETLRIKVQKVIDASQFGNFSLHADQVLPLNIFVPVDWLNKRLGLEQRANVMLLGSANKNMTIEKALSSLRDNFTIADIGLFIDKIKLPSGRTVTELTSRTIFIPPYITQSVLKASRKLNIHNPARLLTYFVNSIDSSNGSVPYSMVTAINPESSLFSDYSSPAENEIYIDRWTASELSVNIGDKLKMDYYIPVISGQLKENTSEFVIKEILPMQGPAVDSTLMPKFPGLADVENCRDWQAGSWVNLERIRPEDEKYWDLYRGAPKAFISLKKAQKMWKNRWGDLTALRFTSDTDKSLIADAVKNNIDPAQTGLIILDVRKQAYLASENSTDFGSLFLGLGMFLIAAALILTSLNFSFGIEKRTQQTGLLLAMGFTRHKVRNIYLGQGLITSITGTLVGLALGVIYTRIMIWALSTIWSGAVAGTNITLHIKPLTLLISALISVCTAMIVIWMTTARQFKTDIKELLNDQLKWQYLKQQSAKRIYLPFILAILLTVCSVVLVIVAAGNPQKAAGTFFASGAMLLIATFLIAWGLLSKTARGTASVPVNSVFSLALKNTARRRARSLAVIMLFACGVFMIIAVGANTKNTPDSTDNDPATGGFELIAQSALPIPYNLNTPIGKEEAGFEKSQLSDVEFLNIRVKTGDDASCLNLNRAQRPRLFGMDPNILNKSSFRFVKTAKNISKKNWDMLNSFKKDEQTIAAVGDLPTVIWALGKGINGQIIYTDDKSNQVKLKIVGIIHDSVLQGGLIISEDEFINHFGSVQGYEKFLIDVKNQKTEQLSPLLSKTLRRFGFSSRKTTEKLMQFNAVQNTYLSIFELLSGLGIIIGTAGLALVVLKNVLDRRAELAMLRAVGLEKSKLKMMILYEHTALMFFAVMAGLFTALVAVANVISSSAAQMPLLKIIIMLAAVITSAVLWIWLAAVLGMAGPLINALKAE